MADSNTNKHGVVQPSKELDHLDKMAEQHASNPMVLEINKLVVALLPTVPKDAHVLDFGCGAGRASLLLGKHDSVASVVGTDISEAMIATANKLLNQEPNPKVSFQLTERMPDLETFKASKDLVIMSLVLGHIHPKEAGESVLAAAAATLKKGGQFALAEFLFVAGEDGGGHDHSHEHSHSHSHSHSPDNGDGGDHKSHHGGHVAYTEEEIRGVFSKSGLKSAEEFTPFEFEWGGVSRKCIMAVGTKI